MGVHIKLICFTNFCWRLGWK